MSRHIVNNCLIIMIKYKMPSLAPIFHWEDIRLLFTSDCIG
jgi:hypothetical protein